MHSIPLHILSLIVDELDILDDVKRLSLGNKSLRDAATSRLFRSIRITSSHSQAVVQRMRHFAPRYGHVVRHLTFELTFAPYRGHRGFVRYDSIGAHEILSASLAAVLQLLNNVTHVVLNVHGVGTPSTSGLSAATYTALSIALSSLRKWESLSISVAGGGQEHSSALVAELLGTAAAKGVRLNVLDAPHRTAFDADLHNPRPSPASPERLNPSTGTAAFRNPQHTACGQEVTEFQALSHLFSHIAPL